MTFVLRFCIVKESYFAIRYFIFSFSRKTILVKRKDKVLIFDFLHRTLQRNLKLCFRIPHKHSKLLFYAIFLSYILHVIIIVTVLKFYLLIYVQITILNEYKGSSLKCC